MKPGRPWAALALIAVALLLAMSAWFTATAIAPDLAVRWALTPAQVG
jgi:hypothetical protein